jgi:RNA polymerase sigma factor (sigma-70 family)
VTQTPPELWRRWRGGDATAFAALVVPELGRAVAVARGAGCDASAAEDAVQDALVQLAREATDAPVALGVRTWLLRAVRDRARSSLRANRRRRVRERGAARPEAATPRTPASDTAEVVECALATLAEDDREAVRLRCALDLDYREVAAVLGTSEGAARVRVHRALEKLRTRLGGDPATLLAAALPLPVLARPEALVADALAKSVATAAATTVALGGTAAGAAAGGVVMASAKTMVVGGALVLAAGVGGVWAVSRGEDGTLGARDAQGEERPTRAPHAMAAARPEPTERTRAERPSPAEDGDPRAGPFETGRAILKLGDGYVFGQSSVLPPARRGDADVVCLDITAQGASFRCPGGARAADMPLAGLGLPRNASDVLKYAVAAPADLHAADVTLPLTTSRQSTGVAFVRSSSGRTYAVAVIGLRPDAAALSRNVVLSYTEVPAAKGGGRLDLPGSVSAKDAPSVADLEGIIDAGAALPGDSFADFLRGDYVRPSSLPAELVMAERSHLLVEEPLTTAIQFDEYSGLVAARGIAQGGVVRVRSYVGVAVRGHMAGTIDAQSYAYVHVSGDVTGKIDLSSYATVVVDGDLLGEIRAGNYIDFLLRGRLVGKLAIETSNSDFWFERRMSGAEAEALGTEHTGNTLHLRESDLAPGKHQDVPGWQEVVVGEEAWSKIAR